MIITLTKIRLRTRTQNAHVCGFELHKRHRHKPVIEGEMETTKHTAVWSTHWICHCEQWCLTVLRLWNHKPATTVMVTTHFCNYRFKSRQGLNMFLFDKLKSVSIGSWDPMNESFWETVGLSKLQDYSSSLLHSSYSFFTSYLPWKRVWPLESINNQIKKHIY